MGKHFFQIISAILVQICRLVSRTNPKANERHVILGVVGWMLCNFANQMNLRLYEVPAGSFEDGGKGEIIEEADEVDE